MADPLAESFDAQVRAAAVQKVRQLYTDAARLESIAQDFKVQAAALESQYRMVDEDFED